MHVGMIIHLTYLLLWACSAGRYSYFSCRHNTNTIYVGCTTVKLSAAEQSHIIYDMDQCPNRRHYHILTYLIEVNHTYICAYLHLHIINRV